MIKVSADLGLHCLLRLACPKLLDHHDTIRIYYEFVDKIHVDSFVLRVTVWHHKDLPSDAKQ